ncbi:MAG: 50S ribosomal protein L22 [Candidatus Colwellbacteria bacterium RBG_13_48_8]|uniref:Large ribosomal subunit protein uL22 n=1 Tax=Candidatus Colwellbacteria bacterium RBG_13_48_8 TaxID=1797685 RepID=A0A1G1YXD4_9BACT|nr:MAG: 50S ribosomal protein L22 [Candidatus Colwellbacteria bacterium RBG_13_48_8]
MATTDPHKLIRATLKNVDVAPRKMRLLAGLVKGRSVNVALAQLQIINRRGSDQLAKLIRSAIANAKEGGLDPSKLVIDGIVVDKGQVFRSSLPKGRGRVSLIERKRSHVSLRLKEVESAEGEKFAFYEKPKKVRQETTPKESKKSKFTQEKEEQARKGKKPGFVQRFFRRKSV